MHVWLYRYLLIIIIIIIIIIVASCVKLHKAVENLAQHFLFK